MIEEAPEEEYEKSLESMLAEIHKISSSRKGQQPSTLFFSTKALKEHLNSRGICTDSAAFDFLRREIDDSLKMKALLEVLEEQADDG